ncbi:hypothetical protein ABGN50_004318, partial [Escherichia coli]
FSTDLKKLSIFVGLTSALNTVTVPLTSGLTITGLPVFDEYHWTNERTDELFRLTVSAETQKE